MCALHMLFFCIKSALLYHLLITKCAPSVSNADFADLVHSAHSTQPVTGLLGWSVGQHMAHELM